VEENIQSELKQLQNCAQQAEQRGNSALNWGLGLVGIATLIYFIGKHVDFKPIIGDEAGKIATTTCKNVALGLFFADIFSICKYGAPLAGKIGVTNAVYAVGHYNVSSKYNDAIQKIKKKKTRDTYMCK